MTPHAEFDALVARGRALVAEGAVEAGLRMLGQAFVLKPFEGGLQLVDALMTAGRPAEAVSVLAEIEPAPDAPAHPYWLRWRAYGRAATGNRVGALDDFRRLDDAFPDDPDILYWLTFLTHDVERRPAESAKTMRLQASKQAGLPESLEAGLTALQGAPMDRRATGHPLLDWVRRATNGHGMDDETWLRAVAWGGAANRLLRDWWQWKPAGHDQLRALLDPVSLAEAVARIGAVEGGVLLLCGHLGALDVGVAGLQAAGTRFRRVGFAGHEPAAPPHTGRLILATGGLPLREVVWALAAGEAVGWPVDSPFGDTVEVDLAGHGVRLSAAPLRLVRAGRAAAAFWFQPLWEDGRVTIDCERMPGLRSGETDLAFEARWYAALSGALWRALRSDPRNLVLGSGLWDPEAAVRAYPALAARIRTRAVDL